jgi:hypothetical protein
MNRHALIGMLALLALATPAADAAAQDVTAEVRTWAGQSWHLSNPSLEVFYTIVAKPQEQQGGQGQGQGVGSVTSFGSLNLGALGRQYTDPSLMTLNRLFGQSAPDTIQGHRQGQEITVYRSGTATQIPFSNIATLTFTRRPIRDSSLPPYVAPTHARYGANVVLVDGTRVDADYVNLGTAILRGSTPDGRMDIPWQDIEVIRLAR